MNPMTCQSCQSSNLTQIEGQSGQNYFDIYMYQDDKHNAGVFLPDKWNLGTRNLICFALCLNCGKIQGEWPVKDNKAIKEENNRKCSVSYCDC